jgi:hypothetical protein
LRGLGALHRTANGLNLLLLIIEPGACGGNRAKQLTSVTNVPGPY